MLKTVVGTYQLFIGIQLFYYYLKLVLLESNTLLQRVAQHRGKCPELGSLGQASGVTLGELLSLSEPQFFHL